MPARLRLLAGAALNALCPALLVIIRKRRRLGEYVGRNLRVRAKRGDLRGPSDRASSVFVNISRREKNAERACFCSVYRECSFWPISLHSCRVAARI